jgi:hypothetical protein
MLTEPDTLRYALMVSGGAAWFIAGVWIFCFLARTVIDGVVLGLCLIRAYRFADDFSEVGER